MVAGEEISGQLPDCDDLRKCSAHKIPINRCWACWPQFKNFLGHKAWELIQARKKKA